MKPEELITAMSGLMSITGYEFYDEKNLLKLIGDRFDETASDAVGNHIFVRRCGRKNAPKILIDTHFDEIGMYVTDILEGGFLTVTSVGGLDLRTLPSAEVRVYGKKVIDAVIASTPPHLRKPEDKKTLKPMEELLVDTGYPEEELREFVRVGTPVGFMPRYESIANRHLAGKAFDNKICCAAAVLAVTEIPAAELAGDVYLLFSVHEETDAEGGTAVGGFAIEPDYAMVADVNLGTVPDTKRSETVGMGKGPSITFGSIIDRRLTRMLGEACDKAGIPWQRCVEPVDTGTNTGALHLVRGGIPVVDVGLPLRSMHTYVELIDMKDFDQLVLLMRTFATSREIAEAYR